MILVYLGPTLDLTQAKLLLPEALFLPPARHGDIVSHVHQYNPTHILLIDGDFAGHLPVWHKELSYAALRGIRVYGASSMGALRASELADYGVMIGVGKIFHWYWEGVLDADDEVALLYSVHNGAYHPQSVPLVNIRAGLLEALDNGSIHEEEAEILLTAEQNLYYASRFQTSFIFDQKKADAIELLSNFRNYDYVTDLRPDQSYLTPIFTAMMERERRIEHSGATITLQNIDSYISLHSPVHHQISWDSKNRSLALILADMMAVEITPVDIQNEWTSFCARHHLDSWDMFLDWLKANAMSKANFDTLTIQNARITKMHKALVTTQMWSRQTQTMLDYLRTHNGLQLWMEDCADVERQIVSHDNEDLVSINMGVPMVDLLKNHFDATGLEISGSLSDYLRETGIGGIDELRVCLERYALARRLPSK